MSGANVKLTVDDAAARALLQGIGEAAGNKTELMHRLGEYLEGSTKARFDSQTKPDGSAWAALNPAYARRKERHRDKVLTLTEYLRRGIRFQAGPDSVAWGTDRHYAAIHQFGGTINYAPRSMQVRLRRVKVTRADGSSYMALRFAKSDDARGKAKWGTSQTGWKVTIQARPFLGLSDADKVELQQIAADWLASRAGVNAG